MTGESYGCVACGWYGDDPTSREVTESYEFWGEIGTQLVHELSCPDCGRDVEEAHICEMCGEKPAPRNSDRCKPCDLQVLREERAQELRSTLISIALAPYREVA